MRNHNNQNKNLANSNGRPYTRLQPNTFVQTTGSATGKSYIFDEAFSNRNNDSRYDKTFQAVWISNKKSDVSDSRGSLTVRDDTAIWVVDFDVPDAPHADNARPSIKDFHVLRPILQDQIDRVPVGPKFPQNPGYWNKQES